ncbi:hypothetical protein [Paenibacillus aceti]|nr:hypothetical protein [Paenibacillus aceti]
MITLKKTPIGVMMSRSLGKDYLEKQKGVENDQFHSIMIRFSNLPPLLEQ